MNRVMSRKGILEVTTEKREKKQSGSTGLRALQLDEKRDALLYVPPSYDGQHAAPLAAMLHGAGGDAQHGMSLLQPLADAQGLLLLSPPSRGGTWDIIEEERFGTDVLFISAALQQVFDEYAIDTNRLAIGGFSDGASYALSLGLINGDLFTHVLAFSPGFYVAPEPKGKPVVFISHGTHDHILPIQHCSRRIVPRLENLQYSVWYHEFDGEHVLPDGIRKEAVRWFLKGI